MLQWCLHSGHSDSLNIFVLKLMKMFRTVITEEQSSTKLLWAIWKQLFIFLITGRGKLFSFWSHDPHIGWDIWERLLNTFTMTDPHMIFFTFLQRKIKNRTSQHQFLKIHSTVFQQQVYFSLCFTYFISNRNWIIKSALC